ncbi:MAG: hypothetical protein ABUT20_41215 [Bacteroidota bacterium]
MNTEQGMQNIRLGRISTDAGIASERLPVYTNRISCLTMIHKIMNTEQGMQNIRLGRISTDAGIASERLPVYSNRISCLTMAPEEPPVNHNRKLLWS